MRFGILAAQSELRAADAIGHLLHDRLFTRAGTLHPRDNLKPEIFTADDLATRIRIRNSEGLSSPPVERDPQRAARFMPMHNACEVTQVHARGRPAEVEDDAAIGRSSRLLQQQQGVNQAGFTRTVRAKEAGDRPERNVSRILPGFEVLKT